MAEQTKEKGFETASMNIWIRFLQTCMSGCRNKEPQTAWNHRQLILCSFRHGSCLLYSTSTQRTRSRPQAPRNRMTSCTVTWQEGINDSFHLFIVVGKSVSSIESGRKEKEWIDNPKCAFRIPSGAWAPPGWTPARIRLRLGERQIFTSHALRIPFTPLL